MHQRVEDHGRERRPRTVAVAHSPAFSFSSGRLLPRRSCVLFALAAIALGTTAYLLLRPVIWGVQGRVTFMRDSVPVKEGAVLVPREGEQSMMREANKGSEWELTSGGGGAAGRRDGDEVEDNTIIPDDESGSEGSDATSGDENSSGDGGGGGVPIRSDDEYAATVRAPPVDLSTLPRQFATLRDTIDISTEVRSSMMNAGWREPIVNTTSPRHLYTQLRAQLRAFVRARRSVGRGPRLLV